MTREKLCPVFFFCKCDCLKTVSINASSLSGGKTRSCGCYNLEVCKRDGFRNLKHGRTYTPEYKVWEAMKRRCCNPKDKEYARYGGRGIRVCDRWLNSFENFIEDMGERPTSKHSIDRLHNDQNYEPNNCLWRTAVDQANNRSSNKYLLAWGEQKTIAEWSRDNRCVVSYGTLAHRLKRGVSGEIALTIENLKEHRPA